MNIKKIVKQSCMVPACFFITVQVLSGCAGVGSMFVAEDLPTISHVHIGHAITAWKKAPGQKGLLVLAEELGQKSLMQAEELKRADEDLAEVKSRAKEMLYTLDPSLAKKGSKEFGLKMAFTHAVSHLTFAAQSDDATQNVIDSVKKIETDAGEVAERIDLIIAMTEAIVEADSDIEANVLIDELVPETKITNEGTADGAVGLNQIHDEVYAMLDRENPPYQPIAEKYLFGLIRLPDGKWMFSWLLEPAESENGGGEGGGGGY